MHAYLSLINSYFKDSSKSTLINHMNFHVAPTHNIHSAAIVHHLHSHCPISRTPPQPKQEDTHPLKIPINHFQKAQRITSKSYV
ncbi:hypothetical protein L2E82_40016 [Cichorium intybus]|uniref:Uncharacterized protein n=1 Tax=Cichorium intybus TaxID=13427 RepID=A0ACB9AJX0_CICIN|nr:hypothetical protein L2E82_40016 [Cichorium intybus]